MNLFDKDIAAIQRVLEQIAKDPGAAPEVLTIYISGREKIPEPFVRSVVEQWFLATKGIHFFRQRNQKTSTRIGTKVEHILFETVRAERNKRIARQHAEQATKPIALAKKKLRTKTAPVIEKMVEDALANPTHLGKETRRVMATLDRWVHNAPPLNSFDQAVYAHMHQNGKREKASAAVATRQDMKNEIRENSIDRINRYVHAHENLEKARPKREGFIQVSRPEIGNILTLGWKRGIEESKKEKRKQTNSPAPKLRKSGRRT